MAQVGDAVTELGWPTLTDGLQDRLQHKHDVAAYHSPDVDLPNKTWLSPRPCSLLCSALSLHPATYRMQHIKPHSSFSCSILMIPLGDPCRRGY